MSDPTTLDDVLRGRRTVHVFRDEPVPDDLVERGVALARWAPNHRLTEPWRFVLLGPAARAAIVERNAQLVEASRGPDAAAAKRRRWSGMRHWLVVTCLRDADPLVAEEDYAATCCAVHSLSLFLWSRGVGMKWTTGPIVRDPRFAAVVGFDPARERAVGLFWYGIPEEVPAQRRRPVAEILRRVP